MDNTFTRRMFLLPRRAMVLIDFRFRSNSSVANVCNLHHMEDSSLNTEDMMCGVP